VEGFLQLGCRSEYLSEKGPMENRFRKKALLFHRGNLQDEKYKQWNALRSNLEIEDTYLAKNSIHFYGDMGYLLVGQFLK
jgi:hypothetical protein